jgi:hypothetical protein
MEEVSQELYDRYEIYTDVQSDIRDALLNDSHVIKILTAEYLKLKDQLKSLEEAKYKATTGEEMIPLSVFAKIQDDISKIELSEVAGSIDGELNEDFLDGVKVVEQIIQSNFNEYYDSRKEKNNNE